MKPFLLLAALILSRPAQDVHVATWSTGKPETDSYESLSFWIKGNQRAYIRYAHGKEAEDIDLTWLSTDSLSGIHDSLPAIRGCRVSSPQPGANALSILPQGTDLHVFDGSSGLYDKTFHWENENGDPDSTARCSICAQSSGQAMDWLRRYFF
jgi:hypothetical protein